MMAFDKVASVNGSTKKYQLNPNVKKYTLRDHGFQETKSGNFQLTRSLTTSMNPKQGILLKIVVDKDLQTLRMSTTNASGLKSMNVYANKNMQQVVENLEYILAGFVEQNLFVEVD